MLAAVNPPAHGRDHCQLVLLVRVEPLTIPRTGRKAASLLACIARRVNPPAHGRAAQKFRLGSPASR